MLEIFRARSFHRALFGLSALLALLPASVALAQSCPWPDWTRSYGGHTHYVEKGVEKDPGCQNWGQRFKTLTAAAACARPGDTIYVREGWYDERVQINARGTASNPITIAAYPNEWVMFSGDGKLNNDYGAVVNIDDAHYINFSGFEVGDTGVFWIGDWAYGAYGIRVSNSSYLNIKHNRIHNTARHGVTINGCHITAEKNEIWNTSLRNRDGYASSHDAALASWVQMWNGKRSVDINFINNYVHDNWGECIIALHVNHAVVSGNLVRDCFSTNVYIDNAEDVMVNGNYIYATSDKYNRAGERAAGIMMAVEDYTGNEYVKYTSTMLNRITISNNIVGRLSVGVKYSHKGIKNGNNSYDNVLVSHNIIKDIFMTAVRFEDPPAATPGDNNALRNNVIYNSYQSIAVGLNSHADRFLVDNNIFPNGVPGGLRSDNSGSNMAGDPGFVSPVIGGSCFGFRVKPGSKAKWKGKGGDAWKVPFDYWGRWRNNNSPSIGIWEPYE